MYLVVFEITLLFQLAYLSRNMKVKAKFKSLNSMSRMSRISFESEVSSTSCLFQPPISPLQKWCRIVHLPCKYIYWWHMICHCCNHILWLWTGPWVLLECKEDQWLGIEWCCHQGGTTHVPLGQGQRGLG